MCFLLFFFRPFFPPAQTGGWLALVVFVFVVFPAPKRWVVQLFQLFGQERGTHAPRDGVAVRAFGQEGACEWYFISGPTLLKGHRAPFRGISNFSTWSIKIKQPPKFCDCPVGVPFTKPGNEYPEQHTHTHPLNGSSRGSTSPGGGSPSMKPPASGP